MYICPVCETQNTTPCCSTCGFDESRNYESYPTFSRLEGQISAISQLQAQQTVYLRCENCGSIRFLVDMETLQFVCTECKLGVPVRNIFPIEVIAPNDKTENASLFKACPPMDPSGDPVKTFSGAEETTTLEHDCGFSFFKAPGQSLVSPEDQKKTLSAQKADSVSVQDWKKSEAAHREWLKASGKQSVPGQTDTVADWRKSEAAHREWLKSMAEEYSGR